MSIFRFFILLLLFWSFFLWTPLLAQTNQNAELQKLVNEKEQIVLNIRNEVLKQYKDRCKRDCSCSLSACESKFPDGEMTCTEDFGNIEGCDGIGCDNNRVVNFKQSVIRTSTITASTPMKHAECWTKGVDKSFIEEKDAPNLSWQYFGTPTGVTRIFPGFAQEQCASYDPRLRPWYVAATSGPKDVIIIIDTSGSMDQLNRINIAKEATTTVLGTLTFADFVNVITFSSDASQLRGNHLFPATEENLQDLKSRVENIRAFGNTNFYAALQKAFDLFDSSSEYTSGCQKVILFMTDGELNQGLEGNDFYNYVSQRNAQTNAVIFTYSFGAQADETYTKTLACQHHGTWSKIDDGGNLRDKMASYYEYFSILRNGQSQVVWAEPYEDAFGAGEMTTASIAVYDEESQPPSLIGVVGVDLLTKDLKKIEPNYQNLLDYLIFRSATCPSLVFSECELEYIRTTSSLSSETSGDSRCNSSLVCTNITTPTDCTSGSYPEWCNTSPNRDYKEESCCSCISAGVVAGIVIGSIAGLVILIVGLIFLIKYIKSKKASESSNSYKMKENISYNPPPYSE